MTQGRRPWEFVAPGVFLFILPVAHTTPLRAACIVLSVLTAAWMSRRGVRGSLLPPSLVVALAAWIVFALVACLNSIEPSYSWGEFRNEVLATTAMFGVFFWLTDGPVAWQRWRAILLASCVAVTTIAIVAYLRDGDWLRSSFVGDRNAFSTYVVLIVPFLLATWIEAVGNPLRRGVVAAALLLALVSGACTQNRNMWFGIAAECVLFAMLFWFRSTPEARRRLRVRYLVSAVVGIALFCGTLAFVIHQKAVVSNTSTEEQTRFDRDPRFEIWAYAGEKIRERPWTGYGYGRGILRSDFRTHFDNILKWHGHNMFIDAVMGAGVFGGIALIGLFVTLGMHAWRIYRTADDDAWHFGAWPLAMLVGIVLKVMTDDIMVRESSLLFWSVMGIAFGFAARAPKRVATA